MVYFVGAGPGDPELITLKGKRCIESADTVIYAGSLVNPDLLEYADPSCSVFNSAGMTLDEVINVMIDDRNRRRTTVRLHTGDPSIFSAVREQADRLDALRIAYEIVPGVSAFSATAASLKREYTLPGVTQTVIITRMEGRTAVPPLESIESLAAHQATMVFFLSAGMMGTLTKRLMTAYTKETPAAVVYKASWPEQIILRGNLSDIAWQAARVGISNTALLVVGRFLGDAYELSKLYDGGFSHGFREATK